LYVLLENIYIPDAFISYKIHSHIKPNRPSRHNLGGFCHTDLIPAQLTVQK